MCDICTFTFFNIAIQVISIVMNLIYVIGTYFMKNLKIPEDSHFEDLKVFKDSLDLYLNTIEYTSIAMIPIQITLIVMAKCCCKDICGACCYSCINEEDDEIDKNMRSFSMNRSEFTL